HETRIEFIGDVAAQDPAFDEYRTTGRSPFVIHVERAPPARQRSIIDDRTDVRRYPLIEEVRECGGFLAIEVCFQAMANGFVKQNPRPPSAKHNRHDTGRLLHGREVEYLFTCCFTCKPQIPI